MIKALIPPENKNANLVSYQEAYRTFSSKDVEKDFTWHKTGDMNIAHEAVDRWAGDRDIRDRKALVFEKGGAVTNFSYMQLRDLSCQWANLLIECGFAVGDRLFIFLPPSPEIYFAMLACARLGIIFSPVYPNLGFDELEIRIKNAKPRGIITHPDLINFLPRQAMESVDKVIVTEAPLPDIFPGKIVGADNIASLPARSVTRWLRAATPLCLMYTSGSNGPPKGIVHAHQDMLGYLLTARNVLNITERSVLWTDADPGLVTGMVYGAFAPWLCGAVSVVQGDTFAASTWYRTLERHRVSTWYTTPRTIARLQDAGDDLPGRYDLSSLQHIATVGENLAPEQFFWTKEALKHSPHDTWWMTETGMICLANFPSMAIKPGSMGKPVPGIEAEVLDENGEPVPDLTMGELALRPGWPSMMTGIWMDPPRYQAYFRYRDWFLTGDMVTKDEDGYYYHQGRNDDIIKLGDRCVGPYEIEQVLLLHPSVAEAAAISLRSIAGKTYVKVFLTPKKGLSGSARLNQEIKAFMKANFSPEIPLKEVVFMEELPKTRSGKLLRRVLRAHEHGLPSGDPTKLME